MGELGLNKIFGALLAVALVIMGMREISAIISGDGHHGHHHYESVNKWAESNFKGYRIPIPETGSGPIVEVIYDLGALLAAADPARGERSFKAKCASCHTLDQGGANGTGPNLYNVLGNAKQTVAGFGYSGALSNTEGDWSWENMDTWLQNPSAYARGTNMAFAGLKRDDERAAVLLYLASLTPSAPAQPEPLPVETAEASDATETAESEEAVYEDSVNAAIEAAPDTAEAAESAIDAAEAVVSEATPALEAVTEASEAADTAVSSTLDAPIAEVSEAADEASNTVDAVTDTADEGVSDLSEAVEDAVETAVETPNPTIDE